MEPVLRSIELATHMTNNTDLDALLALRLEGGHLPQADLSGPHPFRGSAPGAGSMVSPGVPPRLKKPVLMPVLQRMAPFVQPGSAFFLPYRAYAEGCGVKARAVDAVP